MKKQTFGMLLFGASLLVLVFFVVVDLYADFETEQLLTETLIEHDEGYETQIINLPSHDDPLGDVGIYSNDASETTQTIQTETVLVETLLEDDEGFESQLEPSSHHFDHGQSNTPTLDPVSTSSTSESIITTTLIEHDEGFDHQMDSFWAGFWGDTSLSLFEEPSSENDYAVITETFIESDGDFDVDLKLPGEEMNSYPFGETERIVETILEEDETYTTHFQSESIEGDLLGNTGKEYGRDEFMIPASGELLLIETVIEDLGTILSTREDLGSFDEVFDEEDLIDPLENEQNFCDQVLGEEFCYLSFREIGHFFIKGEAIAIEIQKDIGGNSRERTTLEHKTIDHTALGITIEIQKDTQIFVPNQRARESDVSHMFSDDDYREENDEERIQDISTNDGPLSASEEEVVFEREEVIPDFDLSPEILGDGLEEEEIVFSDEEVSSDFSNFDQDNEGVTTQDVVIENLDGEEADDSAEEILRDDILSREGVQTPDDLILLEDEEVFDDYNTLPEEGEDLIPLEDFPKIPIIGLIDDDVREETQNESGKFNLFYGKGIIFSNDFVFDLVLEHSSFSPNRSKVAHSQKSENFDLEDEIWTLEKNIEASNADGDQDISPYLGQTNTIDSRETISSQQNFSDTIGVSSLFQLESLDNLSDSASLDLEIDTPSLKDPAIPLDDDTWIVSELNGFSLGEGILLDRQFEFGLMDQHAVFSKPIKIQIDVRDRVGAKYFVMQAKHTGDTEFSAWGISTDPHTQCKSDGSATIPSNHAEIIDGEVVFYLCGASTFALGYVPSFALPNGAVRNFSLQSDNKLLVGGEFTTFGGESHPHLARLYLDGTLDEGFFAELDSPSKQILIQNDGKILLAGSFSLVNQESRPYLARLETDGSLDLTFNPIIDGDVSSIALQSDGKILLAGSFTSIDQESRSHLARLETDGSLDTDFDVLIDGDVSSITLQNDGKILLGGSFSSVNQEFRSHLARLEMDGSLDTDFDVVVDGDVNRIALQSDGKILLAGSFTSIDQESRLHLARLEMDASLDLTFNPGANGQIHAIATQNQKIFIGGEFTRINELDQSYFYFMENTVHHTLYHSFINAPVYDLLKQSDGKILLAGAFTGIAGLPYLHLARLHADGSLDVDFNPTIDGDVSSIALQSDGKILLAGSFTSIDQESRSHLARLEMDGSLDTDFDPVVDGDIATITIQNDGKILLGGSFSSVDQEPRFHLARLYADGSLDLTFNPIVDGDVSSIAIQNDGKILLGGSFSSVNQESRSYLARLETDGSLDLTFDPIVDGDVSSIAIQNDGKILLGGSFSSVDQESRSHLARLETDGSLDLTFNPIVDGVVKKIYLWDDIIFIGGGFGSVGEGTFTSIAKLDLYGDVDQRFSPIVGGASPTVWAIVNDNEGNLIIGGSFETVNNNSSNAYLSWIGLGLDSKNAEMFLWIKSDEGIDCFTDQCDIGSWQDFSDSSRSVQIDLGEHGILQLDTQNTINFHPTIHLHSALLSFSDPRNLTDYTSIYVLKGQKNGTSPALLGNPDYRMFFSQDEHEFYGYHHRDQSNYYSDLATQRNTWQILSFSSNNSPFLNITVHDLEKSNHHLGINIDPNPVLGLHHFSSLSESDLGDFNIAEIMVYPGQLSDSSRQQLRSYLAIKYGFSLDPRYGNGDYFLSNGEKIRSMYQNKNYHHHVAGIVRDDGFDLGQTKSQSSSDSHDIILTALDELEDGSALVWGNNDQSLTWTTTGVNPLVFDNKLNREWFFQERSTDVGNVRVRIAANSLPESSSGYEHLVLLLDKDADFTHEVTVITGTLSQGFYEFVLNIPNQSYMTFANQKEKGGTIGISGPENFDFGVLLSSSSDKLLESVSDYFILEDRKGSLSGYYTTLALSDLIGPHRIVPIKNIEWKADPIVVLSGMENIAVILGSGMENYHVANGTHILIKRDSDINQDIYGSYGTKLSIRLTIPPYTPSGIYTGSIVYTLYQ